jgi:hypothetical protein
MTSQSSRLPPLRSRRQFDLAGPVGLLVAVALLVLGGNLAGNGVSGNDVVSGMALPGWEGGSMLRVLTVWMGSWFTPVTDLQTGIALVYVGLATVLAFSAFRLLLESDWPAPMAVLALAMVAGHGVLLYAVTQTAPEFLLVLVAALLIPSTRRLESVGDVQSIINLGLTLPLLLLAGPPLAALVPYLVFAVPLSQSEARGDLGVFGSLLLVAVVPVLIIIAGIWAMSARAGIGLDFLAQPFIDGFTPQGGSAAGAMVLLAMQAPAGLVVLVHCVIPDRRRKIFTSMLAVLLPIYVAWGNAFFGWGLAAWTPAALMIGTTLGWLCATRVRAWMRWLVLGLLAVGLAASWLLASRWADPVWLDGLLPVQFFSFSLG